MAADVNVNASTLLVRMGPNGAKAHAEDEVRFDASHRVGIPIHIRSESLFTCSALLSQCPPQRCANGRRCERQRLHSSGPDGAKRGKSGANCGPTEGQKKRERQEKRRRAPVEVSRGGQMAAN